MVTRLVIYTYQCAKYVTEEHPSEMSASRIETNNNNSMKKFFSHSGKLHLEESREREEEYNGYTWFAKPRHPTFRGFVMGISSTLNSCHFDPTNRRCPIQCGSCFGEITLYYPIK
ncbi:hypothetical protein CBL_02836 [Carabus blaptoides fortunei]